MSQAGPSSPPQEENQYLHSPEASRSNPPSIQMSEVVDTSNLVTKDELQTYLKNFKTLLTQFQANVVATMPLQSAQGILHFPVSNHQQATQGIQSVSVSNQPVCSQFFGFSSPRSFGIKFCLASSMLKYCSSGGGGADVLPVSVSAFDLHTATLYVSSR